MIILKVFIVLDCYNYLSCLLEDLLQCAQFHSLFKTIVRKNVFPFVVQLVELPLTVSSSYSSSAGEELWSLCLWKGKGAQLEKKNQR